MATAIGILRPRLVFVENVAALAIRGLDRVLADLAALGFDAEWATVRASDVGAPHRRERLFLLASPANTYDQQRQGVRHEKGLARRPDSETAAHPDGASGQADQRELDRPGPRPVAGSGAAAHPDAAECGDGSPADADHDGRESGAELDGHEVQRDGQLEPSGLADGRDVAVEWGRYEPAIRRWERIIGRPAPVPYDLNRNGKPRLSPRLPEWMMGLPDGWITAVPGITRNQALRLAGNGVVPAQAELALRTLLDRQEVPA